VQRRELPDEMTEITLGDARRLTDVLVQAGFAQSKREAERLIRGGGVRLDGVPADDPAMAWTSTKPVVLSVGARRFARVVP
jgi:tyrosyl-tRNA synthetase